ncbi:hypothetical protein [Enterovibrio paralichthyis]|uniref:hypothetical protein n=1 Tax=Enterovibrio paralichthyis TaxID=2853805 RepID=UPI001C47CC7F|nr:hypothetical protein [Enterovibrio paralichthyis]MBV7298192.1 hypothetical protein [Enterovibrio paralichthyis]
MIFEVNREYSNFQVTKLDITWRYEGKLQSASFPYDIAIYDIDDEHAFLIGDLGCVYLLPYDNSEKEYFSISSNTDLEYYYIEKSTISPTGYLIVLNPLRGEHLNKWGDLVQFELDIKKRTIGNKIGIKR